MVLRQGRRELNGQMDCTEASQSIMVYVWMGLGEVRSRRSNGDLRAGGRHSVPLTDVLTQGRHATMGRGTGFCGIDITFAETPESHVFLTQAPESGHWIVGNLV